MPSIKMQMWENEFLGHINKLKEKVHSHITDADFADASEVRQDFLIVINNMFDCGHQKVRRLNKALAFLHMDVDDAKRRAKQLEDLLKEHNISIPAPPPRPEPSEKSMFSVADQVSQKNEK